MNFQSLKSHTKGFLLYLVVAVVLVILIIVGNAVYAALASSDSSDSGDVAIDTSSCNILGINLHGDLYTYIPDGYTDDPASNKDIVSSEGVVALIDQAKDDSNIKAIMLEVDSSGGYPVAGEEIANALKESGKPTVAVIRQSGLSAAYWAASGADYIFASKNSDIGSIGVTSSYVDNVGKNKKDGLTYNELSTGKFKNTGSPDRPLSEEDKALITRDLKITLQNFIDDVSVNRKVPAEKISEIADGSSVLGEKAKSLNLIDAIGSWSDAEKYLEEKIGDKPSICW